MKVTKRGLQSFGDLTAARRPTQVFSVALTKILYMPLGFDLPGSNLTLQHKPLSLCPPITFSFFQFHAPSTPYPSVPCSLHPQPQGLCRNYFFCIECSSPTIIQLTPTHSLDVSSNVISSGRLSWFHSKVGIFLTALFHHEPFLYNP